MCRNRNFTRVLPAIVLSVVLLAGCTRLPGKMDNKLEQNNSNEVQQNLGIALQQEVGKAAANLEQSVEDSTATLAETIKSKRISQQLSDTKDIGSSTVLNISNPVGDIEAKPVSGHEIIVNTTLWFDDAPSHKSDRQEIIDNAKVTIQISGDNINVSTQAKDNPSKDLWSWAEDEFDYSNFSIDYMIEIPDGVDMYQITNNVGKIKLYNLQGTYRVASNVGAVSISGAEFSGKSTVETDTGSIHLDIMDIDPDSSLKVKTDIGSLTASLEKSLKCTLDTKSELGVITGAVKGKSDVNGGGPLISLNTSIGALTVDK